MKKCILTLVAFILIFQLKAQNFLTNGSFENDFANWTNLSGDGALSNYSIATTGQQQGSKCLSVVVSKLGTNSWSVQSIHSGWNATIGKLYRVSFYAKGNGKNQQLTVLQSNPFSTHSYTLTNQWVLYDFNYTPTTTAPGFLMHYNSLGTYAIDNISIQEVSSSVTFPVAGNTTLRQLATTCNLNIGAAVDPNALLNEPIYSTTLKNEFNMVVAENVFKMGSIKPTETGGYNFTQARNLVNFAKANNMKIRGHTILWHEGLPTWVKTKVWTKATLLNFLKEYINVVGNEFKGDILEWDVANEFIQNGNGNILRDGNESVWIKYIGEEVLDSAFKWMHQIDPNAKLFYNDYGAETMNGKSNGVYNLVKRLKERGAPIHGVGLQSHYSYDLAPVMPSTFTNQLDQNIKRLGALGFTVSFTEMDLSIPTPFDAGKYKLQAQSYANILKVALANPTIVKTFLTWGFTDAHSWIPNHTDNAKGGALLYYNDYKRKPAYDALTFIFKENCSSSTCTSTITNNTSLVFCQGGSVLLTASAGSSYKWFKGTTQVGTSATYLANSSGVYTVEVTNSWGCKAVSPAKTVSVQTPSLWYADVDGDGKGDASVTLSSCSQPLGYVSQAGDGCPTDANKIVAGLCGCGIAEGTCANASPIVSFTLPNTTIQLSAPATTVVNVSAQDSDGIANVKLYINGTFIRQENGVPYDWNHIGQDALLQNLAAGSYILKAVATDTKGATGESTITLIVKAVTNDPILGPTCGAKNQVVNFSINSSNTSNATNYSWWFTGSSDLITPSTDKKSVAIKLSQYYTSGSVCVGINLSTAPHYVQYCKPITSCSARMGDEEISMNETTNSLMIYPNPTNGRLIQVDASGLEASPLKIEIINGLGELVYETRTTDVLTAISIENLVQGTYTLKTIFKNQTLLNKLVVLE